MSRIKLTLLKIFIYSNVYSLCHAKLSTGFNRQKKRPNGSESFRWHLQLFPMLFTSTIKRWAGIFNQTGIDFQYFIQFVLAHHRSNRMHQIQLYRSYLNMMYV
uniref:Putative secreted peptide n=1 Tax=Anopheles braziliensis TaxID=58242 RepID=A0A2M3ZP00_9DIPT